MTPAGEPDFKARATDAGLRALLDAAGVRYAVDSAADGTAVARFRLHVSPHAFVPYGIDVLPTVDAIPVRAQLLGPVLRFSAPVPGPSPITAGDLHRLDLINATWRGGWASGDDDNGVGVHVSVYAGTAVPARATFDQALAALRDIASYLTAAVPASESARIAELPGVLAAADGVFAEVPGGDRMDDVESALRRLGIAAVRGADGRLAARLIERDGHDFIVEFSKDEARFLLVCARPSTIAGAPPADAVRRSMHRLNRLLHLGALIAPAAGVYYRAALPLAWLSAIDTPLISWLTDHAASALAARFRMHE